VATTPKILNIVIQTKQKVEENRGFQQPLHTTVFDANSVGTPVGPNFYANLTSPETTGYIMTMFCMTSSENIRRNGPKVRRDHRGL